METVLLVILWHSPCTRWRVNIAYEETYGETYGEETAQKRSSTKNTLKIPLQHIPDEHVFLFPQTKQVRNLLEWDGESYWTATFTPTQKDGEEAAMTHTDSLPGPQAWALWLQWKEGARLPLEWTPSAPPSILIGENSSTSLGWPWDMLLEGDIPLPWRHRLEQPTKEQHPSNMTDDEKTQWMEKLMKLMLHKAHLPERRTGPRWRLCLQEGTTNKDRLQPTDIIALQHPNDKRWCLPGLWYVGKKGDEKACSGLLVDTQWVSVETNIIKELWAYLMFGKEMDTSSNTKSGMTTHEVYGCSSE